MQYPTNEGADKRPRLQSLIFEVTQRCNHACLHCYNVWQGEPAISGIAKLPYPRGELDTAQTLALLTKVLDEASCRHVTLTGGEPLLRRDLPQILEFLRTRHMPVTLISNGRLLSEPMVVDLLDRGVALFELPLLSHQRFTHDRLSGSPGAFDAVLEAMAQIRLHHGKFIAVFVATRLNIDSLYDTIRLAFAFGARGMMLNRFNPGGRGRQHIDELLPTIAQVREALAVANEASREFNLPISCSIPIQPCLIDTQAFPRLGFGFCAAGSERAYYTLDPLGNLRPCNHTSTILGNLLTESLADLVAPARMVDFVCAAPPYCEDCDLRWSCQGGCKAAAQECYGSLCSEEPFLHQKSTCDVPPVLDLSQA
jgi:radical SAM protein with 4Fe4S-binding SPASM domain